MATKPTQGGSDGTWGTELNANIDVGHDSDGTHTSSQMLTDMGWSPTSYGGEQSITFPNGLVIKTGFINASAAIGQLTFAAAFEGGIVSVIAGAANNVEKTTNVTVYEVLKATFRWRVEDGAQDIYWIAIGY